MVYKDKDEILAAFNAFREQFDAVNDKRERLIKSSREVTIQSKRIIFLLHRLVTSDSQDDQAIEAAEKKLNHIRTTLLSEIHKEVPTPDEFWLHLRSISPGIQEYLEAVSYVHFLKTKGLITYQEALLWFSDDSKIPFFPLPYDEFLLGISDVTGELMRLAITSIARGGGRERASAICDFVRRCSADFEQFTPDVRELSKKQAVTKQSIRKIEEANYAVHLRRAEFEDDPTMLDEYVRRSLSSRGRDIDDYAGGEEGD